MRRRRHRIEMLAVVRAGFIAWKHSPSTPSDMARRFLDEIRADRDYWLKRLRRMATPKRQPAER
ncbi:MAG: hypothetical protein ACKV2Q_29505 [Planctomycetaceae bacterium]